MTSLAERNELVTVVVLSLSSGPVEIFRQRRTPGRRARLPPIVSSRTFQQKTYLANRQLSKDAEHRGGARDFEILLRAEAVEHRAAFNPKLKPSSVFEMRRPRELHLVSVLSSEP